MVLLYVPEISLEKKENATELAGSIYILNDGNIIPPINNLVRKL